MTPVRVTVGDTDDPRRSHRGDTDDPRQCVGRRVGEPSAPPAPAAPAAFPRESAPHPSVGVFGPRVLDASPRVKDSKYLFIYKI